MRKNATKIAAMMLSLALTVTSVNIPTTSSAAAKVKLSSTKATLYVGGSSAKKTKTLKATFNGKKVKATFTSSNSKVAKVAKKTGKVTAVKKGSATITAKYKGKKATAKITVKQYVTGVTTSQDVVELKEGEHIDLSKLITVSPASANNKAVSYKSDDSLVAAVNGNGTVLKGVNKGTTSIRVTAKDGSKQYTDVRVNVTKGTDTPTETDTPVTPGKEAKNVEVSLENPFSADYKDTVLVGTNAQLKVRLTDEDGKPVANTEVVLAAKSLDALNTAYTYAFRNLSDSAKRTDADGYVTFVYGLGITHDQYNKPIDATRTEYVSSYKLTASVANGAQASVDVKFGALDSDSITNVDVLNNNVDRKGFPEAFPTADDGGMTFSTTTRSRLGTGTDVEYVSSQTVSSVDGSHKVGIASGVPSLVLPGTKTTEAADINETVSFDTGKYSTYTTAHWAKVIDSVKASRLQYATVNFGKLSLSKYTRFAVQAYIVNDPANPTADGTYTPIDLNGAESGTAYIVAGQKVSGDFAVQIPIDEKADGYLYVTAQVQSKGQVNTDVNEGFTVKNVLGVHRKGAIGRQGVALKDVTVKWDKDTEATYTLEQQITSGIVKQTLDAKYAGDNKAYTYWYKVPAFPRTGNAIIRVLDSTNKVVDYYAMPTENKADASSTTGYANQNVLVDSVTNLHRISEKEATNLNAGTVTSTEAGYAEVDSNDSGITHVVGTLTSTNPEIVIDPTNAKVYSSVHWNPVPVAAAVETHARGAAIVGQQIVLKAQLADKNGNPVAVRNQPVKFFWDGVEITKAMNTVGEAALVKVDTVTNELGQAELVLTSAKKTAVTKISTQAGTTGSGYQLGYVLGNKQVTAPHVDLYWLDANLYFEPNANTGERISTTTAKPARVTTEEFNVNPTVNEHWAYEVRTSGDIQPACDLFAGNYTTVEITGLNIGTTVGVGSKGTVTDNANGKANVTSTAAGTTHLVNVLNRSSIGTDMTFTAKSTDAWRAPITLDYVGTGTPTLDKKLTLDVAWTAGVPTADFIVPTSDKADINEARANGVDVFVQVHDANGNVLKDKKVTMKITGDKGEVGGALTQDVVTNNLGIAKFNVKPSAGARPGDAATMVVEAADIAGVFSYNLKWIDVATLNAAQGNFKIAGQVGDIGNTVFNPTDKTIKLTFTNYVYAPSVIKEEFTVTYGGTAQTVTDVEVANNTVTLKIPGLQAFDDTKDFVVTIAGAPVSKTVDDGVQYRIVSADGQFIDAGDLSVTFDTKGKLK